MDRLSKYILFLFVLISISFFISTTNVYAQSECTGAGGVCRAAKVSCNNGEHSIGQMGCPGVGAGGEKCCVPGNGDGEAFPGISFPCEDVNDPEFHSLRPYQAAVCGDANKALYCSNELKFIESFDLTSKCPREGRTSDFDCKPGFNVDEHNLYVELTDAMFPIVGNTEEVTNSQGGTEEYDDAQKVNEYASWYLSGVNNRAEYGENTDDRVVNFSGPIQKLLPKMIQEAERIKTIGKATISDKPYVDEDSGETFTEPQNHDQVVVCGKEVGFGWLGNLVDIGVTKPVPCYEDEEFRLSKWLEDLSDFNGWFNNRIGTDIWNKRTPPLPWDDGTVENPTKDNPAKPFETQIKYEKAYHEWQGQVCATIPLININLCIENPFVPNKWADLYQYIPLSSTADKKGAERILDVRFKPSNGTEIAHEKYNEAGKKSAPLYFAHTQEVKELSELLNTTYLPKDYKSKPLPKSTEKNVCSAVNVRANKGDDLFPGDRVKGDTKEMIIPGVTYDITQVLCKVTKTTVWVPSPPPNKGGSWKTTYTHHCNAEVIIVVPTDVKVPNADEIFATTVADSGSTFRKIFPKVEEGAPVSCIADMPTVTSVTYNADESDTPRGDKITGSLEFKVKKYPEDSAGDNPELTFPHIGSVYEYFLKGIQTALRPKGYGEPITNGDCKPNDSESGDVCSVADKYGIPCCQLQGVMQLETGGGTNMGSGSCGKFNCCHGSVCGPAQIACGQYEVFAGGDNLDMCSPEGAAELLSRSMLLKLCQADGKCNSYDWKNMEQNARKYSVEDGDYTAACYHYGLQNGCFPTACSQYRWGPGKSYGDSVNSFCKTGQVLPDNTSQQFCNKCNEEIVRAGQSPMSCP